MVTEESILARKNARKIAAEVADLVAGEVSAMSADAAVAFYDELARRLPLPTTERQPPATAIEPFTDAQARAWGRNRMQFGKHQGTAIDEVPLSYLEKLCDANDFTRHLRRYLASQRVAAEQQGTGD